MPKTNQKNRQMVSRFGAAAVAAGLLTPAVARSAPIAGSDLLVIIFVGVEDVTVSKHAHP
jgi:hypothetical protein